MFLFLSSQIIEIAMSIYKIKYAVKLLCDEPDKVQENCQEILNCVSSEFESLLQQFVSLDLFDTHCNSCCVFKPVTNYVFNRYY